MLTASHDTSGDARWWRGIGGDLRLYALLAVAHFALAALFTQPLIFHAGDYTAAADSSCDQYQTIWFFWWMKRALFELVQNPYWTDAIYYPHGTGLGYHLSPLTNLSAIFVSGTTGVPINSPLIYNILLFASFVVTGLGMFALTRQVTGSTFAALVASIVVAVSPFRIWNLNHLNLLSMGWGIWAIHFALRYLSRPRWRTLLAAVVFFAFIFYSSMTIAAFVILFLLAYVLLKLPTLWRHPQRRRLLRGVLLGLLLTAAVSSLGLWGMHATDSEWNLRWQDAEFYSANVQSFVMPTYAQSVVAQWLGDDPTFGPNVGAQVFLGWILLAAVLVVFVLGRRRIPRLWLILAGIFLVISLGPSLRVGYHRFFEGLLPFRWLSDYVPYLNLSRTPMRFVVLAHLCLTVYAAHGLAVWISHLRSTTRHRYRLASVLSLSTLLLVAILFVENTGGTTELKIIPVPGLYGEVKYNPSIEAIYEGPITKASCLCNLYMYCQTFHEKKVANGYLTHPSSTARTLLDQITSADSLSTADRRRLAEAGIDAMVYHRGVEGEVVWLR